MDKTSSVAFVIPSVEYGGAELQVINQINYLVSIGSSVVLIVLDKVKAMRDTINLPASKIYEFNFPVHESYFKAIVKAQILVSNIFTIIKENNVDIVLANLPFTHYLMRLVKIKSFTDKKKFRLINYHHSLQYVESPLDTFFKKAFNSFNSFLARIADDKNIFISNSSLENVQQFIYVKNPVIIYNSVPFKIANPKLALDYLLSKKKVTAEYTIVLPGRLHRAKGHDFFINVFDKFVRFNGLTPNQVQLIFVGGGLLEEQLISLIQTKELLSYTHITGFVNNDLLLSFLAFSSLVVIPSVFEGFGNVALEALMVNKLILASDAGGLKEIIEDGENGFLFKSLNEDECLSYLTKIYHNRENRIIPKEKMAADFLNRFSFDAHIDKLLSQINL